MPSVRFQDTKENKGKKLPTIGLTTGEKIRDKMRTALKLKLDLAKGDYLYSAGQAAAHIESELFKMTKSPLSKEYKEKLKTILLNVGMDKRDLRTNPSS